MALYQTHISFCVSKIRGRGREKKKKANTTSRAVIAGTNTLSVVRALLEATLVCGGLRAGEGDGGGDDFSLGLGTLVGVALDWESC